MRKKLALTVMAGMLSVGLLRGAAHAGQYCERADEVAAEAGFACRAGLGLVLGVCSKVTEKWGHGCALG